MIYATPNKDRFCLNCPYGKFIGDRFFCPFVEGSCIKIPKTIEHPDKDLIEALMSANGYIRIQTNEGRKL